MGEASNGKPTISDSIRKAVQDGFERAGGASPPKFQIVERPQQTLMAPDIVQKTNTDAAALEIKRSGDIEAWGDKLRRYRELNLEKLSHPPSTEQVSDELSKLEEELKQQFGYGYLGLSYELFNSDEDKRLKGMSPRELLEDARLQKEQRNNNT